MANTPARACPLAKKCGGCQLQNLSYDEQLHLKQATAIRLLGRFGHVEEIIGMEDPYHYRNKVQAAFGVNRQGQIISGVYQSASHRIVPVSDCMIEDTVADQIIVTIRGLLKSFKIRPYDEDTGRGTLRHVLVRRGWRSGEILVVLVTAHGMLPGKRNFGARCCSGIRTSRPSCRTSTPGRRALCSAHTARCSMARDISASSSGASRSASRRARFTRSTPYRRRCSTAQRSTMPG